MKARRSTPSRPLILRGWSTVEANGIPGVAVECVEIRKNTGGEGGPLGRKAPSRGPADAEARQRGEQTGLDTLVVHAVNDGH